MFFKERRIPFQLINLAEKPMSKGELQSVLRTVTADELVDTESKVYKEKQLAYLQFDKIDYLIQYPGLMKSPVVRDRNRSTVGYKPEVWKQWIAEEKK
ncbi:ArsC/Spx/MgsR family protein [Leptospira perolatii]